MRETDEETLLELPTQNLVLDDLDLDGLENQRIEDVGFSMPTHGKRSNKPAPSPAHTSMEPWEDVINAAGPKGDERWGSLDRDTSKTSQPSMEPIPKRVAEEITTPQGLKVQKDWPNGRTRPLQPVHRAHRAKTPLASAPAAFMPPKNAPPATSDFGPDFGHSAQTPPGALADDLLENSPVLPVEPVSMEAPGNDRTKLGELLNPLPEQMSPVKAKRPSINTAPTQPKGDLPDLSFDIQEPVALRDPSLVRPVHSIPASIPAAGTEQLPSDSIIEEASDPDVQLDLDPAARLRVPPIQTELELDHISIDEGPSIPPMEQTRALGLGDDPDPMSMPGMAAPMGDRQDTGSINPLPRSDTRSVEIKRSNQINIPTDPLGASSARMQRQSTTANLGPDLAAPKQNVQPSAESAPAPEGQLSWSVASGKRRFFALLLDGVLVSSMIFVPMLMGVFGEKIATAALYDPDDLSQLLVQGELTLPIVCFLVLMLLFSALSHALAGRSLGKLALGLEIVHKKTGARPGKGRSILRTVLSIFSLALGGIGYFWLLLDRRARTLHDLMTGTMVVQSSSKEERAPQFVNEATL